MHRIPKTRNPGILEENIVRSFRPVEQESTIIPFVSTRVYYSVESHFSLIILTWSLSGDESASLSITAHQAVLPCFCFQT